MYDSRKLPWLSGLLAAAFVAVWLISVTVHGVFALNLAAVSD
jgi:hypothetical protein